MPVKNTQPSFSSIPCVCAKISIAYRQIHKIYADSLRKTGLTNEQVSIMIALHRMGEMPQQELGNRFAIDWSSLSRNRKLLVEAKLVRAGKMDGKSILLTLTAKGTTRITAVLPDWLALQQKVTEVLGIHTIREIDRVNDVLKELQPL